MLQFLFFFSRSIFVGYSHTDNSKITIRGLFEDTNSSADFSVTFLLEGEDPERDASIIPDFAAASIFFPSLADFTTLPPQGPYLGFVRTLRFSPPGLLLFSGTTLVTSCPFPYDDDDRAMQIAEWVLPDFRPIFSTEALWPRLGNLPLALLVLEDIFNDVIENGSSTARPCTLLKVQKTVFQELGFESESLLLFRRADRVIIPVERNRDSIWNASSPYYAKLDVQLLYHKRPVAVYFDERWDEVKHFPLYLLGQEFPGIQFGVLERVNFEFLARLSLSVDVVPNFLIITWFQGSYHPDDAMRGLDMTDPSWPTLAREYVNGFLNGSVPTKYISEKISATMNRGPLVALSGETYWDFVNESGIDVVVIFYIEQHSEKINSTELEAAATTVLESGSTMKFGFINLWMNSIGESHPRLYGYPHLGILPANNKTHGVAFFGQITKNRLLRFFKTYSVNPINIETPTLAPDEVPLKKPRPKFLPDYEDFLPAQMGDRTRVWRIEKKLSVDSRVSVFFFVVDDDPNADQTRYILKCVSLDSPVNQAAFKRELANMERLQDSPEYFPQVVHAFYSLGERSFGCIVMTYASEGDLSRPSYVSRSETERRNYTRKMALALAAFHTKGMVHDDVKLANFVVTSTGDVLLIDFESAWALPDQPTELSRWGTCFGDSRERAAKLPRAQPSDAWGLGCAIWSFWEGGQYTDLVGIAEHGEIIPFTTATPPDIRHIVTGLLAHNPEDRLTAQQVVEMIDVLADTQ
jgi:hypothetical protein